jgi:hypothetical protein
MFAFLVSIQKPEVKPEGADHTGRGVKELKAILEGAKSEIDRQNEAIKELSDRIGRAEIATVLRPGGRASGSKE